MVFTCEHEPKQVYSGGVNCTSYNGTAGSIASGVRSGEGNGNDEEEDAGSGRYTPVCGVDVVVSPGGDDKYR